MPMAVVTWAGQEARFEKWNCQMACEQAPLTVWPAWVPLFGQRWYQNFYWLTRRSERFSELIAFNWFNSDRCFVIILHQFTYLAIGSEMSSLLSQMLFWRELDCNMIDGILIIWLGKGSVAIVVQLPINYVSPPDRLWLCNEEIVLYCRVFHSKPCSGTGFRPSLFGKDSSSAVCATFKNRLAVPSIINKSFGWQNANKLPTEARP